MDEAWLTREEVFDLIDSILDAVEATEGGMPLRETWPYEMRDWCVLLLDRLEQGGISRSN